MSDQTNPVSENAATSAATLAGGAAGLGMGFFFSPFKSKLFFVVLLLTLGSTGWLVARSLTDMHGNAALDSATPWMLRAGISFIAAFIVAWLVRKVIKIALLVGAVLVGGAVLIHKLGLGLSASDIDHLKSNVADAANTMQATADTWWTTIKTYLPSGTAAGAGLWRGARHNV
jgi:uncharacterized membrane protein (Fun14 family)